MAVVNGESGFTQFDKVNIRDTLLVGGKPNLQIFYVDWSTGAVVDPSATTSPSGNIGVSTTSVINTSAITAPSGDTLDTLSIIHVEAEVYDSSWGYAGWLFDTTPNTAQGTNGWLRDTDKLVVQTGNGAVKAQNALGGATTQGTALMASAPCRIRIVAGA